EGALGLDGPGPVTLRFDMDGHDYAVDARVLRTWRGKRGLSFAVARFIRVTGPFEQALARKVRAIERKAREAKESSPA
ncbi:MAG: hypothetical protein ABSC19_04820, partial [Syntrophorhabdales bacterium]